MSSKNEGAPGTTDRGTHKVEVQPFQSPVRQKFSLGLELSKGAARRHRTPPPTRP